MNDVKKNKKSYNCGTILASIICFFVIFVFQIVFNQFEVVPRSLPDEVGAMATSARLAGEDWSYILSKAGLYYGFGTTWFLAPCWKIIKDPMHIYQFFLGIGAMLRTIPVFFIFIILKKMLKIKNNWMVSLIAFIAIIGAPTRATNIDNEPMMVFIGWLLFFLICVFVLNRDNQKRCVIVSVVYSVVLVYSLTVHTRAYIYVLASVFTFILYQIYHKKLYYKCLVILPLFLPLMVSFLKIKSIVEKTVYTSDIYKGSELSNTVGSVSSSVFDKMKSVVFTKIGMMSMSTLIESNTWIICVYYCGFVFFAVIGCCLFAKKYIFNKGENNEKLEYDFLFWPLLFSIIVFIVSLLGLAVSWIEGPIEVLQNEGDLTRGFFYLRYIGNTFGPILLCSCYFVLINFFDKWWGYLVIIIELICSKLVLTNSINVAVNNGNENGDWFGYFAPLSLTNSMWGDCKKNQCYYISATVVSIGILLVILFLYNRKKIILLLTLLAICVGFEYGYSVVKWDYPFSKSANYYGSIDGTYELRMNSDIFEKADTVYYCNDIYGPQFIMQLILYDVQLINDYPENEQDNMIILLGSQTENLTEIGIDIDNFSMFEIDDNERIATNNKEIVQALENMGYVKNKWRVECN